MKRCCTYLIPSDWSRLLLLLLLVLTIVTQSAPNTRHPPLGLFLLILVQANFGWDAFEHVQPNGLLLVFKVVRLEEHLWIWMSTDRVYTSAGSSQGSERYTWWGSLVFNLSGADGLVGSRIIHSTPERLCISLLILVNVAQKVLQTLYFLACLHFLESFAFLLRHLNSHFGQIWAEIGVLGMQLIWRIMEGWGSLRIVVQDFLLSVHDIVIVKVDCFCACCRIFQLHLHTLG